MALGVSVPNVYQNSPTALDLAKLSMNHMPRANITRLFQTRKYAVLEGLLVTPSGKLDIDGGEYGVEQRLEVADNNNARGNRLYGTSTYKQVDVVRVKITPWIIDENTWSFDSREISRNRGSARIVNIMDTKQQACLRDLIERLEAQLLGTPVTLSDDLSHNGLLFWCRGLNTGKIQPEGGYNGIYAPLGDGTLTPQLSRGNLSCDASDPTNTRLRGWGFTYDGTYTPLLARQIRQAIDQSTWETPFFISGVKGQDTRRISQFRIYWPEAIGHSYADAVNQGPDDRDGNISPFYGDLKFGPAATVKTPKLNNVANLPILGVDHSVTKLKVIQGEWLAESESITDGDQPTVAKKLIWCQSTVDCDDVRRNFCGHTPR